MNKKTLENFKSVLANIPITEDQKNTLNEFFTEFSEKLKEKLKTQTYEELKIEFEDKGTITLNEDEIVAKVDEAKAVWEEEKEKEIADLKEVLTNSFAEELSHSLEELYDTIEEKVKIDMSQSKEYAVLDKIKESIMEIVEETDIKKLADEIKRLKAEANTLQEFVNESTKKEVIEDLISDFSSKNQKILKSFLEDCSTEEEIYKTFSKVVEVLQEDEEDDSEDDDSEEEDEDDFEDDDSEEEDEDEDDEEDEDEEDEEDDDDDDSEEAEEKDYQDDKKQNVKSKIIFNEQELAILKKVKNF